jgi:hypothetical protein
MATSVGRAEDGQRVRIGGIDNMVEVRERRGEQLVLGWTSRTWKSATLEAEGGEKNQQNVALYRQLLDEIGTAIGEDQMMILTDARAQPVKLLNADELLASRRRKLDTLLEEWRSRMPAGTVEQAFASLDALQPDKVEAGSLEVPKLLLAACGLDLRAGGRVSVPTTLFNPFGGAPFTATGTASLAGVDPSSGLATVEIRATANPDDVRRTIEAVAGPEKEDSPDRDARVTQVDQHVMNTATGWPVLVTRTTRIEVGKQVRLLEAHLSVSEPGAAPAPGSGRARPE